MFNKGTIPKNFGFYQNLNVAPRNLKRALLLLIIVSPYTESSKRKYVEPKKKYGESKRTYGEPKKTYREPNKSYGEFHKDIWREFLIYKYK